MDPSSSPQGRRAFGCVILFVFLVGALVVVSWVFKAAFMALGFALKLAFGLGGIIVVLLLLYLVIRGLSGRGKG